MTPKTILVIGANRGIGLNLLRVFGSRGWTLFGSIRPETREDDSVKDLQALGATILEIDYKDEQSIIKAAKTYGAGPLDVLVNSGGIPVYPENFLEHTAELLTEQLKIMTIGPFLATKAFLPNLEKSEAAKIINISSAFGSISGNRGGYIGYRMAKAAINQQTRTIAMDLKKQGKNVSVVAVHPGAVATKLSGWNFDDDMNECMTKLADVIEGLTIESTGAFLNFDGAPREY